MIVGVVLAAGRSRRMGTVKALLPVGGVSLLERWIVALRGGGCERIFVVAPPGAAGAGVRESAGALAEVVVNPAADSEQIDSLRVALRALPPEAVAVVAAPVDVAEQSGEVIRAMIEVFHDGGASIVLPSFRGERGHPALFARAVFPELLSDPLPEGARTVIHARADRVVELPVELPGILLDLDTPGDYRRLLGEGR